MSPIANQEYLDDLEYNDPCFMEKAAFALAVSFFSHKHDYLSREQATKILEKIGRNGIPDAFAVLGDNCNAPDDEECSREVGEYYAIGASLGSTICKDKLAEWKKLNQQ